MDNILSESPQKRTVVNSVITMDKYEVVDSKFFIAYNDSMPIDIKEEISSSFSFTIRIITQDDETKEQKLQFRSDGSTNLIEFTCYNFNNSLGTGTIAPVEIGTLEHKKMYIHFWIYLLGGNNGKTRKVEYTIWKEK